MGRKFVSLILFMAGIIVPALSYSNELRVEPSDIAPFYALQGQTNLPVFSFELYTPTGTVNWSALKVYLTGTNVADSDISAVKVYKESGTTPGFQSSEDVLISSGTDTFSGGVANVTLSSVETISTTATVYYVVYDISVTANLSATVGGQLGADSFVVDVPNTVNALYLPFTSKEIDILEGRPTIVSLNYTVNACDKVTLFFEFTGDENGNSETLFQYCVDGACTWIDACASVKGASPRQCTVVGLDLNANNYDFRAVITDPDGINGVNAITAGPTAGCATPAGDIPVVNILYPKDGDVVSGNTSYPVKIRVSAWDAETDPALLTLEVRINNGGWVSGFTYNSSITDASGSLYVFEYDWVPPQPGMYSISVRAMDGDNNYGYAFRNSVVYVNSVSTYTVGTSEVFTGTGNLLVRDEGDMFCIACHTVAPHGGYVWRSTKYGYWVVGCRTCHAPHGTRNIYLIRENIETPYSGVKTVLFKALSGAVGDPNSGVLADDTDGVYTNMCEVCHTRTKYHRNDASTPDTTHHNAEDCTTCHPHAKGFSPSGESSGGQPCSTCHADLYNPMNSDTTTYHHYLQNADAIYPQIADPSTITTTDPNRNCLMCHADHDIFNPTLNPSNSTGRSANLRTTISTAPSATSGYTNTDFDAVTGESICVSCHSVSMTKNTTNRKDDGTSQTMVINGTDFLNSAHNYFVSSTFGTDNSTFNANCSKCHSDLLDPKSGVSAQNSTYKFGPHYSPLRWILDKLGIASPTDPIEEDFCYQCHSGGTAGNDYYGVQAMSASARSIHTIMTDPNKPYKHDVSATTDVHRAVEGYYGWQPSGARHVECTDCHNPHSAGQGNHTPGQGGIGNANKGVWGVSIVSFGTTYNTGTANFSNNSQIVTGNGTNWTTAFNGCNIKNENTGIVYMIDTVNSATQLTLVENYREQSESNAPYTIMCPKTTWGQTDFTRVDSASNQYEICFKCHTPYGWDNSPPTATWWNQSQTNVAADFNPYQLAYHPLFAPGRNQPPDNANPNWSTSAGRKSSSSPSCNPNPNTGFDNTFVDCWGKNSLVTCSDCHNTDAPGNGVPEGPHASAYQWILKGIDQNVTVTFADGTVCYLNKPGYNCGQYTVDNDVNPQNLCLNCHRRDVYGDRYNGRTRRGQFRNFARWSHPDNDSCYKYGFPPDNQGNKILPIPCLNCHGGRAPGQIHGSNLGVGTKGTSAQGFRFMNGASWQGHTTTLNGGTCYTIGSANSLSSCTKHGGGKGMSGVNYQY